MPDALDGRAARLVLQIDALRSELDTGIANAGRNGKRYRRWSFWLILATVTASFAAAILAGVKGIPPTLLATVAALPGVLALITSNLKLEGRAVWFYRKRNALKAIRSRLLFPGDEQPNVAALAREQDELRIQMSNEWAEQLTLAAAQQAR